MLKSTLLTAGLAVLLATGPTVAQNTNSGTDKFAQLETPAAHAQRLPHGLGRARQRLLAAAGRLQHPRAPRR